MTGPALYIDSLWTDVPGRFAALTSEAMVSAYYRAALAFSDEFRWNALIDVFAVMHLIGMSRGLAQPTHERAWIRCPFSALSQLV